MKDSHNVGRELKSNANNRTTPCRPLPDWDFLLFAGYKLTRRWRFILAESGLSFP